MCSVKAEHCVLETENCSDPLFGQSRTRFYREFADRVNTEIRIGSACVNREPEKPDRTKSYRELGQRETENVLFGQRETENLVPCHYREL